jgi:tRNA A37 threonylcarbamoyladenosine dehydratase
MENFYTRTEMMLGENAVKKLKNSAVLILGAGGVGSYAIEALARVGIGRLGICDADVISESNVNRQLFALNSTLGQSKARVAMARVKDINPCAQVDVYDFYYDSTTSGNVPLEKYDYIIDAIDTMGSKVLLICEAKRLNVKIISALSAGNKLDPLRFEVSDIFNTSVCPIAKILRKKLKDAGVDSHKVVYSKEPPTKLFESDNLTEGKRNVGSISFVPSVMGLILAKEAVFDIIERE